MNVKQTIERNAAEILRLKQAIDDAFLRRSESPAAQEAWKQACEEFHARYDALAFPGGLTRAFGCLSAGDLSVAEAAIDYLEVHPYFFRSQYNATMMVRRLRKLALTLSLQRRLDLVLEARIARKSSGKTPGTPINGSARSAAKKKSAEKPG